MSDPYKVLGVLPSASNEEVKKAYRELSRKYHPDNVANNPLKDLAEEKFKEVQEAYKQIMDMRENGNYNGGSGYSNGTGYSSSQAGYSGSAEDRARMNTIRMSLNSRRYQEALRQLNTIYDRNAEWHYLYAVANAGIGNNMEAMNHAQQAVNMDPGNREFTSFLDQLQMRGSRYQSGSMYNGRSTMGTGNLCCDLWILDTLCECMGGDLCSCM